MQLKVTQAAITNVTLQESVKNDTPRPDKAIVSYKTDPVLYHPSHGGEEGSKGVIPVS